MTELESWNLAIRVVLTPWLVKGSAPPVRIYRIIALSFMVSLLLVLWVLSVVVEPDDAQLSVLVWVWMVTVAAVLPVYFVLRRNRTIWLAQAIDARDARGRYPARMFLLFAVAEFPALLAFVVAFTAETLTPYLITLPVTLVLFAVASPRAADVRQVQELIDEYGGDIDLAGALMGRAA